MQHLCVFPLSAFQSVTSSSWIIHIIFNRKLLVVQEDVGSFMFIAKSKESCLKLKKDVYVPQIYVINFRLSMIRCREKAEHVKFPNTNKRFSQLRVWNFPPCCFKPEEGVLFQQNTVPPRTWTQPPTLRPQAFLGPTRESEGWSGPKAGASGQNLTVTADRRQSGGINEQYSPLFHQDVNPLK